MTSKRSSFTEYQYEQILIYEYKSNLYLIQRGQQGVTLNPAHGEDQRAAENVNLYAKVSIEIEDYLLGSKIIEALGLFDTEPPNFEPWETEKLRANIKKWLGAKGQNDIKTNTRLVDVVRRLNRDGGYEITPYDNFNSNLWCGPMENSCIMLASSASQVDVAKSVRQAFQMATHHPNYSA
ncbi:MAG: hypothetical protein LBQ20_01260 [Rhodanobacter sp.]|jgi:hypothetical protein|nr:hypothetical protein [Rhodanobacter sp.]